MDHFKTTLKYWYHNFEKLLYRKFLFVIKKNYFLCLRFIGYKIKNITLLKLILISINQRINYLFNRSIKLINKNNKEYSSIFII